MDFGLYRTGILTLAFKDTTARHTVVHSLYWSPDYQDMAEYVIFIVWEILIVKVFWNLQFHV